MLAQVKEQEVNDSHGHDAGDEVLRQVARTLEGSVREQDLLPNSTPGSVPGPATGCGPPR